MLVLVLGCILMTFVFARHVYKEHALLDRAYLSTISTFFPLGLLSFFLMRFGLFDLTELGLLLILITIAIGLIQPCSKPALLQSTGKPEFLLILSLIFVFGIFYALFPTYYLLGGRDPGLYLLFSVHISETGGLNLDLPWISRSWEKYADLWQVGYPGIYSEYGRGLSDNPGELVPQFMHLFPSYGAIAYSVAGLEGVVRINSIIGMTALFSMFIVARRLVPLPVALLATLALGLNPAFIWNTRITLTETLAITLLLAGVFFAIIGLEKKKWYWGLVAGAVLAIGVLNRVDALISSVLIAGLCVATIGLDSKSGKVVLAMLFSYALGTLYALWDGYAHTYPYFYDLWTQGSLKALVGLNFGSLVVGTMAIGLNGHSKIKLALEPILPRLFALGTVATLVWYLFSLFIRPNLEDSFNARAAAELGWYLPPFVVILGMLGALIASGKNKGDEKAWFLALIGLSMVCIAIFTFRPSITPDHIWASRRWVSQVIPLTLLLAAMAVHWLWNANANIPFCRTLGISIVSLYFASALIVAKPYLFVSMLDSLAASYKRLAEEIELLSPNYPVFTRNEQIASILTYVYQKPTVLVTGSATEALQYIQGEFLFLGDESLELSTIQDGVMCGTYLEKTRGALPNQNYERCYSVTLSRISETEKISHRLSPLNNRFGTGVGVRDYDQGTILSNGSDGFLLFGPYIDLPPGDYMVTWQGAVLEPGVNDSIGFIDVTYNRGKMIIARQFLPPAHEGTDLGWKMHFSIDEHKDDIEFRFFVEEGVVALIEQIELIEK